MEKTLGEDAKGTWAQRLGVSRGTWHNHVTGKTPPKVELLIRLSQLGVNLNWLATGEGDMFLVPAEWSPPPDLPIDHQLLASSIEDVMIMLSNMLANDKTQTPAKSAQMVINIYLHKIKSKLDENSPIEQSDRPHKRGVRKRAD